MNENPDSLVPEASQLVGSSREFAELIGTVVTHFAEVEFLCSQIVWLLLVPEDVSKGRIVTSRQNFSRVLDLMSHLSEGLSPDLEKRTKELKKKADSLRVERNKTVHSVWSAAGIDEHGEVIRGRIQVELNKGRGEIVAYGVGLEDVRELVNQISDVVLELDALTDQIKGRV